MNKFLNFQDGFSTIFFNILKPKELKDLDTRPKDIGEKVIVNPFIYLFLITIGLNNE
jgi:hypothetical protein